MKKQTEQEAAQQAWKEILGGKSIIPYYMLIGQFSSAHIEGAWPVDIFFAGFYDDINYTKKHSKLRQK